MRKILIILTGLLIVASCKQSANNATSRQAQAETKPETTIVKDSSYRILSEKENVNPSSGINKCNIEIELKEKVSKDKLISIANKLRSTRTSYDFLWIFYYLPNMKTGIGAWATTHFTPQLQVNILGPTTEEETKLKTNAKIVDGNIIGEFFETQYTSGTYTVYEKNKKIFIKIGFKDGSSSINEMAKKELKNGTKLNYKNGDSNGEYFILTEKGILEFYNSENKMFTSASKTK